MDEHSTALALRCGRQIFQVIGNNSNYFSQAELNQ